MLWTEEEHRMFADPSRLPFPAYHREVAAHQLAPTIPRLYGQTQWIAAPEGRPLQGLGVSSPAGRRFLTGGEVARVMGAPAGL